MTITAQRDVKISQSNFQVALIFLLFCNIAALSYDPSGVVNTVIALLNVNLFLLFGFLAWVRLSLTIAPDLMAGRFEVIAGVVCIVCVLAFSPMGIKTDIGFSMIALAVLAWRRQSQDPAYGFIMWIASALAINLLIAPIAFVFIKPLVLNFESILVSQFWGVIGFANQLDGSRLIFMDGLSVRLVGACSAYNNISYAFLCFTAFKCYLRVPMRWSDMMPISGLILLLILGNVVRIGLMAMSEQHYEFWHNGTGAELYNLAQFIIIFGSCWGVIVGRPAATPVSC